MIDVIQLSEHEEHWLQLLPPRGYVSQMAFNFGLKKKDWTLCLPNSNLYMVRNCTLFALPFNRRHKNISALLLAHNVILKDVELESYFVFPVSETVDVGLGV